MKRIRLIAFTKDISEKSYRDVFLWFTFMKNILSKHSKLKKKTYNAHDSKSKEARKEAKLNPELKDIKRN